MSYDIAMTGLSAVNEQLNTVSNNIANAGTTGFKSSRTVFGSIYAGTQAMGVEVLGNTQSISQGGALSRTGRSLDLGISGGGFFVLRSSNGDIQYSRAGVFGVDPANWLVNAAGQRVQGYSVDANGELLDGAVGDIQFSAANLPAQATQNLGFVANLDADATALNPQAQPFDPDNAGTYTSIQSSRVYDSLGREQVLTQYFVKTGDNNWQVHYRMNGNTLGAPQTLGFSSSAALSQPGAPLTLDIPAFGGAEAMSIAIDYAGSTQYGSPFLVTSNSADGHASGEQSDVVVEKDGSIYANYSNGQRRLQGRLVLANFVNPEGLRSESGTAWSESADSGAPLLGAPGMGPYGSLTAGALENSNVDLTRQLVNLMEGQRNYQANTRVLSTDKELTQVLFGAI